MGRKKVWTEPHIKTTVYLAESSKAEAERQAQAAGTSLSVWLNRVIDKGLNLVADGPESPP